MSQQIVEINLHGQLGELFGPTWKLAISSASEAINAINILTNGALYRFLGSDTQAKAPYRILLNQEDFISSQPLDSIDNCIENVKQSNLVLKNPSLKTIDIVPVLEGAKKFITVILGALMVIAGIVLLATGYGAIFGVPLLLGGLGLLATGIIGLLAKPPSFNDFGSSKGSYLFSGPQNITNEGGGAPIGYGRLLVGSQVIAASYNIYDVPADEKVTSLAVTTQGATNGDAQRITVIS